MNENTLVCVCGYAGDARRVKRFIRFQEHHGCPVIVMSPANSRIEKVRKHICRYAGKRAYIGQESLDRQVEYFKIALEHPFDFFLMNDSDSFIISKELPRTLYDSEVVWVNLAIDPRAHESKYPKFAFQPPYFLSRQAINRMLAVVDKCPAHPITPYVDHFMVQLIYEAGLKHRPFSDLEKVTVPFTGTDPWKRIEHRIKYYGAIAMHPIKTDAQANLCYKARKFYESKR